MINFGGERAAKPQSRPIESTARRAFAVASFALCCLHAPGLESERGFYLTATGSVASMVRGR
jgi:hypothetical protein